MSVSTGDLVAQIFTTSNPTTGASADADSLPTGVLWVDGVANGAAVTIADATGTGRYTFSVTMPTLTTGQRVSVVVAATIAAIACAGEVWSDQCAPSANVTSLAGQSEPVDNLVLALGTSGLVEKLNSMLEAAGLAYRFTVEALAEAPTGGSGGSGTGTYTDTIKDPSNNPLDGARVQLSTDAAGAHRVYEAFTNALGVFVMNPDPGTYYRWIDLAGYTDRLTQGAQVTVT